MHTHRINRSDDIDKLNAVRTKSKSFAKEFSKIDYFEDRNRRIFLQNHLHEKSWPKNRFLGGHVTNARLNGGKALFLGSVRV